MEALRTQAQQAAQWPQVEVKEKGEKKKTNRTWEAFQKSKGCFIVNDPKFYL